MRQLGFLLGNLSDIVQQAGPLGEFGVEPQFGSHHRADVGHLAGVLQEVLPVGGAVFHTADQPDQFDVQAMDAQVDTGALAGLQNLVLELLLDLRDHLLDAGRVDAAVDDQLVERQPRHFAAHGVEGGKQDGVGGVVDDDLHARGGLQGADVAAFAADDTALDLIVVDGEGRDRVLDGGFRRGALDGVDDDPLRFLGRVEAGFVHGVVDIGLGLRTGFGLHVFDQQLLRILRRHAGDGLQLLVRLGAQPLIFLGFLGKDLLLGLEAGPRALGFAQLALQFVVLLVDAVFLLADPVLGLAQLAVLLVDEFLVLALQLQETFLRLVDLVVLDGFRLDLGRTAQRMSPGRRVTGCELLTLQLRHQRSVLAVAAENPTQRFDRLEHFKNLIIRKRGVIRHIDLEGHHAGFPERRKIRPRPLIPVADRHLKRDVGVRPALRLLLPRFQRVKYRVSLVLGGEIHDTGGSSADRRPRA